MSALANLEAEQELLGRLMQDNRAVDAVADHIDGADFSVALHERLFTAILGQVSQGKPANAVTIKGHFEGDPDIGQLGGTTYLARLTGGVSYADPVDTAKLLRDLSVRRRMQVGLSTASVACSDLGITTGEIVDHADAAVSANPRDAVHQPSAGECFAELIKSFDNDRTGVTCGAIPSLDGLLGPLKPKQLVIGAGRPGMGKTAMALSYALHAAMRGHGVLFVSLEMSSTELAARMAGDLAYDRGWNIPFAAIRDGNLSQDQRRQIGDAGGYASGLPLQIIDAGSLTTGRLNMLVRRHARRMAARGVKLELVVVDYLQLLSPDQRGRSNYESVSEVSRALKALAKDNGLAVFALAQLSRDVEKRPDKRPQLSDLRDSGQIEQDADAVVFLLRREYYLRFEEPEPMTPEHAQWEQGMASVAGKIEFILAKRRNGATGNATGNFYSVYQAVRG